MMCNNFDCGCRERISCIGLIGLIIAALFTFTLGLIFGAVFSTIFRSVIAAISVLAVVFFVMLVVWVIVYFCRRRCD